MRYVLWAVSTPSMMCFNVFQLWVAPPFLLCIALSENSVRLRHKNEADFISRLTSLMVYTWFRNFSCVNTQYTQNLVRISTFYVIWTQLLGSDARLHLIWWWKQVASISHTRDMLTVLFYSQPYSKLSWKTWGHNSKKVISSQLPEAYSFLLITPVMSPSVRLCHSFTAPTAAPSLFLQRLPVCLSESLSAFSASATKK